MLSPDLQSVKAGAHFLACPTAPWHGEVAIAESQPYLLLKGHIFDGTGVAAGREYAFRTPST